MISRLILFVTLCVRATAIRFIEEIIILEPVYVYAPVVLNYTTTSL